MGWLWGAKKESDVSSETKSSGSSKEMPAVPKDEPTSSPEVDPDDGRQVADAHKQAIQSCKHLKDRYDQCFNNWYRHAFLRGDLALSCDEYFEEYRACLVEDMEARGLGHLCMFGPDKPADFDEGND
ncbi:conserved hypothetical protein [Perkinsus marinus ATCC 50983]|uniref:TP53-regulated inhibitor of apoptosis n=1 Tax=Perkinsus marinus (strain ATCC 50983 / TXsc) TaxID=423536 RepID=C5KKF0_PERM5|nr:conserved hypothetical protein [Perkinsus marinus ATCC 50983]EER15062.1 conserved hypothetical protein [Perkinsus marinus ATCC 50983]|eukprot:XP_002783266.1 conserved hypothetical protein [Perkinsus marinus ATCC 50983]